MKKKLLLFVFLILLLPVTAMSGDSNDIDPKMEKYKVTDEELHNIAVNYYKFRFEEEHEFKGVRVDSSKSVIMNITPLKDGDITLAYIVNYNPEGNVFLSAYKNLGRPTQSNRSGTWTLGVEEGYLSIDNKEFQHPALAGYYVRLSKALKKGKSQTSEKEQVWWDKFNVNPKDFHQRADFSKEYHPPKWWLKKKAQKILKE